MTTEPANSHPSHLFGPAAWRTPVAFVLFAILGALCIVWGWALVLPQLRVIVIDCTHSADAAIGWYRFLDFTRIASVLIGAIGSGLIGSNIVSRRQYANADSGG